jgi:O-antigen ligase
VAIAANFFLLSNPLAVIHRFSTSLIIATFTTLGAAVWDRHGRNRFTPWPVAVFLAFTLLSALWSLDRSTTLAVFLLYLLITSVAAIIVIRVEVGWIADGLLLGALLVVLISIATCPPEMLAGLQVGFGLPGVGTNRNILAYTLALALPALFRRRLGWCRLAALMCGLVILAGICLSRSMTGFLAAVGVLFVGLVFTVLAKAPFGAHNRSRRIVWLLVGLTGIAAITNLETLAASFGRSSETLSGRTPFWLATIRATVDVPYRGWGWGAVWAHPWQIAPPNAVAGRIYEDAGLVLTHGHNSLIDLLPQIGIIGVLCYVGILLYIAVKARSVRLTSSDPDLRANAVFVILMLLVLVIFGFTEPLSTVPLAWWCTVLVAGIASGFPSRPSPLPTPSSTESGSDHYATQLDT